MGTRIIVAIMTIAIVAAVIVACVGVRQDCSTSPFGTTSCTTHLG